MSKKKEQEYINKLKEDILRVIRNLHEISDNINVLIKHRGHLKAVKDTCEEVNYVLSEGWGLEDFYYYDYKEED